jgi:hypothetical protein
MLSINLIKKSFADFLSPKLLSISVVPFLISFALFSYIYFGVGVEAIDSFKNSIDSGVVPFLDPQAHPVVTWILTIGIFKWLFTIFFYIVGALALILLSIVIAATVVGFFSPMIVKIIRDKHYPNFVFKNDDFTTTHTIWNFIKVFSIFGLLFLIALPFLFIPGINFFAINIPFYYLYHNMLILDVGSSISSKEEFKTLTKKHKILFRSTTLSLFGVSLVPLVGMVFQVLFIIILSHQFFTKTLEMRS